VMKSRGPGVPARTAAKGDAMKILPPARGEEKAGTVTAPQGGA
jgi:hypothetical protein